MEPHVTEMITNDVVVYVIIYAKFWHGESFSYFVIPCNYLKVCETNYIFTQNFIKGTKRNYR
jgi:hypothetical protein